MDETVIDAAVSALRAYRISGGTLKAEAEARLADFSGMTRARLVGSGFQAVQCALLAAGVGPGDPVVLPTVTCPSVWHAVKSVGASPQLLDVGEDLPLLPERPVHRGRARFVIMPQMFGLVRPVDAWVDQGYCVIEDCAQAQRPLHASRAQLSVFSMSPTKLQSIGYGGAVMTRDADLGERLDRLLSPDAMRQREADLPFRIHAPVSDFQSAMCLAQLERYPQVLEIREYWINHYDQHLGRPVRMHPQVPFRYQLDLGSGWDARVLADAMQARGVMAWPLGSALLHQVFGVAGDFRNAERWQRRLLSLPLHEGLDESRVARVCDCLQEVMAR
jgi:dTDP-4-amino-4,6-dideoxygalactose transaminase